MPVPQREGQHTMTDARPAADSGSSRIGVAAAPSDGPATEERDAGDPADQFVTELYRRHWVGLVRTALVLVGDRPSAEDVVQEAFAGLYRAVPRLRDRDRALGYLRSSVINRCRSVHRARCTALRFYGRYGQEQTPVWSAESAALAREDSRVALQAVARLRGRAREVLALRYLLDLSDGEIAAALGVSKATVSSTATRALAALARELKEQS
jgi:RNA polymerase sigma factor (sigma-70 family)